MSNVDTKPSSLDVYSTIRRLSSLNDESNWDNWSFAMQMMLRGKNLEYVIEGGYKEGFNGSSVVLLESLAKADNQLVSSIIASRVHEENYATISPCQDSARRMWRALENAHQNNTAGGRYMHLRSMMTAQAESDDDVSKPISTMDTFRQRLLNVCPDGTMSIDDLYVSFLISALPETWTLVTAPLKLQSVVTPSQLKKVLRGHSIKLKNREPSIQATTSTAMSTTSSTAKSKPPARSRPECDYCSRKGNPTNLCHQKQMDEQGKEIETLKRTIKHSSTQKSAKAAHLSDSDTDSSVAEIEQSRAASSSKTIKFSRKASDRHINGPNHHLVYNADTGCTDTLVKDL